MTINKLITKAIKHSSMVFGLDSDRLIHKPLFSPETNDIHRLYSYVTEKPVTYIPPFEKIRNYNKTFRLHEFSMKKYKRNDYGLCSHDGIYILSYIFEFAYFDFEKSSFPELSYFVNTLSMLIQYTLSDGLLHYALPEYMCMLADGLLPYEEECFHNFYLIDFSESPDTVEAIKHFSLDINNGNIRFIFKDYNTTSDNVFAELINKNDFIEFLQKTYPPEIIEKLNTDILKILSYM
ncbi:MAG: hypothetical protein K2K16_12235 [Ruminococcus sp.]|nr:hypothetical protein [Ruminococcus sp.]